MRNFEKRHFWSFRLSRSLSVISQSLFLLALFLFRKFDNQCICDKILLSVVRLTFLLEGRSFAGEGRPFFLSKSRNS
jgi:hypothetical protein